MFRETDDLRITQVRPLIPPAILLEEIPLSERASNVVSNTRVAIGEVLAGRDPRLVVVVGPCSIHDSAAALDYAARLTSPVNTDFLPDLRMGMENLRAHKLRSLLTMLGIIIGVGSVIAMMAIGQGANEAAKASLRAMGTNTLTLFTPQQVAGDALRLTLVRNKGAAFGLYLGDYSRYIFMVLTVGALIILWRLYQSTREGDVPRTLAIALVCAGALGNLIDRIRWKLFKRPAKPPLRVTSDGGLEATGPVAAGLVRMGPLVRRLFG